MKEPHGLLGHLLCHRNHSPSWRFFTFTGPLMGEQRRRLRMRYLPIAQRIRADAPAQHLRTPGCTFTLSAQVLRVCFIWAFCLREHGPWRKRSPFYQAENLHSFLRLPASDSSAWQGVSGGLCRSVDLL
jgi:hypothetical protein